jgi:hypothetical protein
MKKRSSSLAVVLVAVLAPLAVAACGSDGGNPNAALQSAGGLAESRLPYGIRGDSPAPTAALPRDKALEAGWHKRARAGEKPPSHNDKASM